MLVTADELGDLRLEMTARVNGEERSRGNLGDLHWTWEELAAHAARNTRLEPGDVLGSGTVGSGCILEHGDGRWLRPGDVVEVEIEADRHPPEHGRGAARFRCGFVILSPRPARHWCATGR